jgi:hypothetical protein
MDAQPKDWSVTIRLLGIPYSEAPTTSIDLQPLRSRKEEQGASDLPLPILRRALASVHWPLSTPLATQNINATGISNRSERANPPKLAFKPVWSPAKHISRLQPGNYRGMMHRPYWLSG